MVVGVIRVASGLRLDTFWHLFVVAAGWETVLGWGDSLTQLLILEVYSLKSHRKQTRRRQLQINMQGSNNLCLSQATLSLLLLSADYNSASDTYLVKRGEIGGTVLIDVFGLVAEDLTDEVVENVWELSWDRELLNILAGHLCFFTCFHDELL